MVGMAVAAFRAERDNHIGPNRRICSAIALDCGSGSHLVHGPIGIIQNGNLWMTKYSRGGC